MSSQVRWGILSTAHISRALIKAIGLSDGSCIQAVASREYTRAYEWAKEHGIPRVFGSYDEMLHSGEIDAIYNPLPNSMHAEWTVKSLEAGLPVLCEKPFTVDAAEGREVAAVAKRKGLLVAEAFMYRYHPMYDEVLARIASGVIGQVVSIRSTFAFRLTDRSNIRASGELKGGALMDVGCYCVNLARRIAGCEPSRAHAFERRTTVDDTLWGSLEFPNGIVSQFECSIESHHRTWAEITGTEGAILIPNPWFPGEEQAQFTIKHGDREETVRTAGANTYRLEVEDFAHAFRAHESVRWPIEDAVANMAVIDALYTSARKGAVVSITKA